MNRFWLVLKMILISKYVKYIFLLCSKFKNSHLNNKHKKTTITIRNKKFYDYHLMLK